MADAGRRGTLYAGSWALSFCSRLQMVAFSYHLPSINKVTRDRKTATIVLQFQRCFKAICSIYKQPFSRRATTILDNLLFLEIALEIEYLPDSRANQEGKRKKTQPENTAIRGFCAKSNNA